ncbi:MAG: SBBP repeat-containing protein, partial [Candidatus Contendobacter sp.]|nr:SBBP repeat-containing protein [Candidatus Contendobacter sp.]
MDAAGTIIYSTYFGGSAFESGYGIAVDSVGNAYVTGYTNSSDFPIRTTAALVDEGTTVRITTGSPLPNATPGSPYTTTLIATGGQCVPVPPATCTVTYTWSLDPTTPTNLPASLTLSSTGILSGTPTNADIGTYNFIVNVADNNTTPNTARRTFRLTVVGSALQGTQDAFIAKIDANGNLGYSKYLGGTGNEAGYGIAVDGLGQAYVTGYTSSTNFPGANFPATPTAAAVGEDTFIVKVAANGNSLGYSRLSGFAGNDRGQGIVLDATGTSAYITGFRTNAANEAAFIAKISPAGAIQYNATLNGPGSDRGLAIARDDATGVYITGYTSSASGIATTGAYDITFNGPAASTDAFAAKYTDTSAAFTLNYATYLGGFANDVGYGITIDSFGNAYVAGETFSPNFPMVSPDDSTWAKGEAFLSRLSGNDSSAVPPIVAGSQLTYSSFWGGAENDSGRGIAKDFSNNVYMVGYTNSPNAGFAFGPITPYRDYAGGVTDPSDGKGGADAFAAKFSIPIVNADFSLAVQLQGSGSGSVGSVPSGIGQTTPCHITDGVLDANADCDATYPTGTSVTLTATPDANNFVFVGWAGSGSGTCAGSAALTCVVLMDAAKTVVANFAPRLPVTVNKGGTGSGTVTSDPAGINCGATCPTATSTFPIGTVVTLTAAAQTGSNFAGWTNTIAPLECNDSTSLTCQVTISAAKTVTANFSTSKYLLSVSKGVADTGTGKVTSSPAGIDCGDDCQASYASGDVSLIAVPAADSDFAGWGGACSGTGACKVTMSADQSVTASFTKNINRPNLVLSTLISPGPGGVNGQRNVNFQLRVKNQGTRPAGAFQVGLYFTPLDGMVDPAIDFNAGKVCSFTGLDIFDPVKRPDDGWCSGNIVLPASLPAGKYYLGAYADPQGKIKELRKDDNAAVTDTVNNEEPTPKTFMIRQLTTLINKPGNGTVYSQPSGIACSVSNNCKVSFLAGDQETPPDQVTLTATPAPPRPPALASDFVFAGWSGACTGTGVCNLTMNANRTVTANFSHKEAQTIGLYNPAAARFYLRNSNIAGPSNITFSYGPANQGWIPLVGDWDGNGTQTIGLYNPATARFDLRNSNNKGVSDITFSYGPAGRGWIPLIGDWDGNGTQTIGLYNPAAARFYLRNSNSSGVSNITFSYGPAGKGWLPLVGDWDGNRTQTIGLYDPATARFYLRNSNSAGASNITFSYGPANQGWLPLVGDWDGNGTQTIGLYNPAT